MYLYFIFSLHKDSVCLAVFIFSCLSRLHNLNYSLFLFFFRQYYNFLYFPQKSSFAFTSYPVLRIYQNIIRMFFMPVLCLSGMGLILIIATLMVLCFGFVTKAVLTVFALLLSSACTASRLSLFPTLCPAVSGRKGSERMSGCLAVGPGYPTTVLTVGS